MPENLLMVLIEQILHTTAAVPKIKSSLQQQLESTLTIDRNLSLIYQIIAQTFDYRCPQNNDFALIRNNIFEKKLTK